MNKCVNLQDAGQRIAPRSSLPQPQADQAVAELTGIHGVFSFPELLLQQIWQRGEFDAGGLRLRDGRALLICRRGKWNRSAGPDFQDAEIVVGEAPLQLKLGGSIEVHLRAEDWVLHRHAEDAAYDNVILHVVLFPALAESTSGAGGRRIPILELLPRLEHDLEAYAEDAAIERIAGRPFSTLRQTLATSSAQILREAITLHAERRWANKLHRAEQRLDRMGWEAACHHSALEVMGYAANRVPMLAVAENFPLPSWRQGLNLSDVLNVTELWSKRGTRPANLPHNRLAQYANWVQNRPDWPCRLRAAKEKLLQLTIAQAPSHAVGGPAWSSAATSLQLNQEICGGVLAAGRLNTMVCDAWLPLLAAQLGPADARRAAVARIWQAWQPGDAPGELLKLAREFLVPSASRPSARISQGELQGLLGWLATLHAAHRASP
jgi:Protein of unknown function (DUF2851)